MVTANTCEGLNVPVEIVSGEPVWVKQRGCTR
jgi:hypothetical protein